MHQRIDVQQGLDGLRARGVGRRRVLSAELRQLHEWHDLQYGHVILRAGFEGKRRLLYAQLCAL